MIENKDWNKIISEADDSGLSHAEYCRQNGIKQAQFTYFKSRLKKQNEKIVSFGEAASFKMTVSGVAMEFSRLPDPKWLRKFVSPA